MTPDIERLRDCLEQLAGIVDAIELELVDDPEWGEPSDTSYLGEDELANPDIRANVAAMDETNRLIAWFGRDSEGFLGLWRGPQRVELPQAPVVRLDDEGQYEVVAATVPDYLAGAAAWFDAEENDAEFSAARRELIDAGFRVAASIEEIWGSIADAREPNDYRDELYREYRARQG